MVVGKDVGMRDVLLNRPIRVDYRCFECDHVVTDLAISESKVAIIDCPKCHGDLEVNEVRVGRDIFRKVPTSALQRLLNPEKES